MQAERLADGRIKLTGKQWSDTFDEAELSSWLAFYDKMHDLYGHAGCKAVSDALRALG